MSKRYINVTENCSVQIDVGERLYDSLKSEYGDILSDKGDGIIIGSVAQVSDIKLPHDATLIIDGRLYFSEKTVFLCSEGTLLQITLVHDAFHLFADERTDLALIPLALEAMLNYYLPQHGFVFLHTASFKYEGKVCAIQAFGGVGKTETALEYLLKGATYISDDVALFTKEGEIIPWPRRISLHDYPFSDEKLRRFGLSPLLYRLKENLRNTQLFPFRKLYCRLRSRFNLRLSYRQLTNAPLPGRRALSVNSVWWMEQGSQTERIEIKQTDFLCKLQACMRHEFSSYVDFEGYLEVVYDFWPSLVQQHDAILRQTIISLPQVNGLKIRGHEYSEAAKLLLQ